MDKNIEHPKVFISYAWSGPQYEQKVLDLASKLKTDGIEVIIDKWSMKPGSDTLSFMEKCVKDTTVNFVLMLLDKKYKEKADERAGGVGIETQIISAQVYKDVAQDKFIPIVFDKDDEGNAFVPIYLNTRFYFDLASEESDNEYMKLVKTLYGRPIYPEPSLGEKPRWVDETQTDKIVNSYNFSFYKDEQQAFEKLVNIINEFECKKLLPRMITKDNAEDVLQPYKEFIKIRDIFIKIVLNCHKKESFLDNVFDFYDDVKRLKFDNSIKDEIVRDFIHESFIYLVAILFKNKQYDYINTILTKTYFYDTYGIDTTDFINYFHKGSDNNIDNAKCIQDDKNYYSGLGQLWMENINENISKNDFVFADVLIYNLSIILLDARWYWFPKTYCYLSYYNNSIKEFSIRLKSNYELKKKKALFCNWETGELKSNFEFMNKIKQEDNKRYRYPSCFEWVPIFLDYIKVDEIGSLT